LSDVTDEDIEAFLVEDETLFVEHKGNLAGEGVNVAKGGGVVCQRARRLGDRPTRR
jgi:hypothetical protein